MRFVIILIKKTTASYLQGLIFVIDTNDHERINEAKAELERMVNIL